MARYFKNIQRLRQKKKANPYPIGARTSSGASRALTARSSRADTEYPIGARRCGARLDTSIIADVGIGANSAIRNVTEKRSCRARMRSVINARGSVGEYIQARPPACYGDSSDGVLKNASHCASLSSKMTGTVASGSSTEIDATKTSTTSVSSPGQPMSKQLGQPAPCG